MPHAFLLRCLVAATMVLMLATPIKAQGLSLGMPPDPEAAQISVVTDKGLTKTKYLPTAALRNARRALLAGERLDDATLRALADRRDGNAAWRLVKRLRAQNAAPSDIAHYAAVAAGQGRIHALDTMIDAMARLDPDTEPPARLRQLVGVLYAHAWAGNSLALDAVIAFNGEGRLLGPLSDATRARILKQAARLDGRVELRLALDILAQDAPDAGDLARVRGYLDRAGQSKTLAVQTTAQNVIALLETRSTGVSATTD